VEPLDGQVYELPSALASERVRGSVDVHWYEEPFGTSMLPHVHVPGVEGLLPQATTASDAIPKPKPRAALRLFMRASIFIECGRAPSNRRATLLHGAHAPHGARNREKQRLRGTARSRARPRLVGRATVAPVSPTTTGDSPRSENA
jgi:hypothetical protein